MAKLTLSQYEKKFKKIAVLFLLLSLPLVIHSKKPEKDWTFIFYMSAVNDLRSFAAMNIKQMTQVGENQHANFVIHLDVLISGNKKITRRYYIEKNKIIQTNAGDPETQQMDSGDPETLISCCRWAVENYPAQHYALVLWNHGTGILDIGGPRVINANDLFVYNPQTNVLDLNRTVGFIDYMTQTEGRGVCWDDLSGNYLSNQKLDYALKTVTSKILMGKKFDIIAFDACLMMMTEVADILEPYAHYMVGSQEVELGTGWRYDYVLAPFLQTTLSPLLCAEHIVAMYKKAYSDITHDYTQSAVDLSLISELKNVIDYISTLLIECLAKQRDKSVKKAIKASRSKKITTVFDEPTYIDLHHWYSNLQTSLKYFTLISNHEEREIKVALNSALEHAQQLIEQIVVANATGKNLNKAQGLSLYFPEKNIHHSYRKTSFAQSNSWIDFLTYYLAN